MAENFMHAVQYDAYGGGAAALKVFNFHFTFPFSLLSASSSFKSKRKWLTNGTLFISVLFLLCSTGKLEFQVQRRMK